MTTQGALSGVTVLDLSRLLPGPFCSMILADHGARVIAIEDKKQYAKDGLFLPNVCRNKEHMTLDLKSDAGREIFTRLVKDADVILEGFRPGVVKRLGVDYDTVRKINPAIVYCSVTGYGQTGPFSERAGHDVNYLGYAGILGVLGEVDRPPAIPGVQIADIAGGGMNAAIGILLALFSREKTGKGQHIDVSMTDSMVSLLPVALIWQQFTGQFPDRGNAMLSHRYACYNTYETADGRFMAVGAVESQFWKTLCEHLGFARYVNRQYDEEKKEEIVAAFRQAFRQKTMAQWETEFSRMDVCVSGINTIEEVLTDPLFKDREMVLELPGAAGQPEKTLGVAVKLSETPGSVRNASISFGANTETILKEYGYTPDQIRQFTETDVI
ncbi:MAG: CoA transferase [Desulfobacterales bacterium]|nr:CoA transferase [Desulfobacterales bacterium]